MNSVTSVSNTPSSKREREDDLENKDSIFRASKKVLRSPKLSYTQKEAEKATNNKKVIRSPRTEEEDKKKTVEKYRKEVEVKELKESKEMDELIGMMKVMMNDIKELKAEMVAKEKKWEKEKELLINRLEILEDKVEKEEKEKRKNNVIIKGLHPGSQNVQKEVEKMFAEKLKVQTGARDAFKISKPGKGDIILVKMESWAKKQEVMRASNLLKGTEIYVEHDLTREERKIQVEIRKIAREENNKGKNTKIGYKKLIIEGEEYKWSKREQGLISSKDWEEEERSKNA